MVQVRSEHLLPTLCALYGRFMSVRHPVELFQWGQLELTVCIATPNHGGHARPSALTISTHAQFNMPLPDTEGDDRA